MDTLSALLALCEGYLPVTRGFPSQRPRNDELWYFLLLAWITYLTNSQVADWYLNRSLQKKLGFYQIEEEFRLHFADINTLRPRQNGRHFADDIFKCILLNENVWIPNKISMKFVPKGPINNIPSLVQIMAWRRPGDKTLSEPMMVSSLTHICITRPQWVKHDYTCQVYQSHVCFVGQGHGPLSFAVTALMLTWCHHHRATVIIPDFKSNLS